MFDDQPEIRGQRLLGTNPLPAGDGQVQTGLVAFRSSGIVRHLSAGRKADGLTLSKQRCPLLREEVAIRESKPAGKAAWSKGGTGIDSSSATLTQQMQPMTAGGGARSADAP